MAEINKREPKDCNIIVSLLPNNSEGFVFVAPPENGGKELTKDMLMSALTANKIVYGLRTEIIDSIVENKRYSEKLCIAVGTPPIDGKNGEISYRYEKKIDVAPVENEHGFVDYKNLGLIRTIYTGNVIADITLPTAGEPGTDVRGVTLHQIQGKKAAYTIGTNTKLTDDGTQIVSLVDGHLTYKGNAFCVESVVTIPGDVDSSVGNIDFIGDVIVKGEVMEGFKVSSNASIVVQGNVNGATLEAGGDVVIKKGCISSKIVAHGNVTMQFCEHSSIRCDGDLTAQNYVISDVYCGGALVTKGNQGGLLGGKYVSLCSVEASNIGTKGYIPTEITVGDNALLAEEKVNLLNKIAKLQKNINDLTLIVNFLNDKKKELKHLPDDKEAILGNSVRQKVLLNVEINNANKRIKEIDASLEVRQRLSVSSKGYIYPGVKITINDVVFKVEYEYVRSCIKLSDDGQVLVAPLG